MNDSGFCYRPDNSMEIVKYICAVVLVCASGHKTCNGLTELPWLCFQSIFMLYV